ncbi:uncharacterized protein LOC124143198 [Haliotis rufescens]|uniref:uncharacterized protein LOC124143198 n=1 Tax=Haliotis rufescens TaxID=6454 RepID=UPI00201F63E1|nr:uncharacterized protein LOC124143198 [Haliotis rufescens]
MNTKFFLTALVAVTLPSLSLQRLVRNCGTSTYRIDDLVVASELSENTAAAAGTGGVQNTDVKFRTYTDQMRSFFTDANSASGNINVGVVYFSNQNTFQYDNQLRPAIQLVTGSFPTRQAAVGATLIGGLRGIEANVNSITTSGRRVNLPIIYASQTSRRDIEEIANIVGRLRQRNVYTYLFAVGSAIRDNNLDNLRGNLTAVMGRDVVFTVPDLTNLGQQITTQVLECDLVIPNSLCSNCIIEESSALIPHPDRCDKYIQCYIQGNQILTAEFYCPHGTLYDRTLFTCQHADIVINDRRTKTGCQWCSNNGERHPYQDSCAAFWQCGGSSSSGTGTLRAQCCPQGQRFDSSSQTCVFDTTGCDRTLKHAHASYCKTYFQCRGEELASDCCTGGLSFIGNDTFRDCAFQDDCVDQNCLEPRRNPSCDYEAVGQCQFRRLSINANYTAQDCPKGLGFDVTTCACSIYLDITVVCPNAVLSRYSEPCQDNFLTTMANYDGSNAYFDDEAPWAWNIKNNNVTKTNNGGVYDGTLSYLSIPRTAGTGDLTKPGMWARVVYQDGTDNGLPLNQPRVLLSNAPCEDSVDSNEDASISITTTPSQGSVTVRLVTDSNTSYDYTDDVPATVQLSYNTNTYGPNDVKTVTYLYENNVLTASLNINGFEVDRATANGNGPIGTRSCGLKVGKGANNERLFKGAIERVEMHFQCTPFPAV